MSAQVINIILGLSIGMIVIAGLMMVDWKKIAARWVAPDPAKARIYVRAGELSDPVNGKLYYPGVKGAIYTYKWKGIRQAVYVKANYPVVYLTTSGRRMIAVNAGDGIAMSYLESKINMGKSIPEKIENDLAKKHSASALDWRDKPVTVNAGDLDAVIRSNIGAEIVGSIWGKKTVTIVGIILLVAVAVGGFLIVKNVMYPDKPAVEQPAPEQKTIEEIIAEYEASKK